MAFIKRVIGPDEKLISINSVHWFYGVIGLFWLFAFLALGAFLDAQFTSFYSQSPDNRIFGAVNDIGNAMLWTCIIIGVILFLLYFIMLIATEIGLTNKRVIYKKGLIMVDVKEVDIEEIKAAEVDSGILGRLLNYGYIYFDARFVSNVTLPAIEDPYLFVKELNQARTDLKNDSMTVVLEDKTATAEAVKEKVEVANEIEAEHASEKKPHAAKMAETAIEDKLDAVAERVKQPRRKRGKKARISKHGNPVVFQKQTLRRRILDNFYDTSNYGA